MDDTTALKQDIVAQKRAIQTLKAQASAVQNFDEHEAIGEDIRRSEFELQQLEQQLAEAEAAATEAAHLAEVAKLKARLEAYLAAIGANKKARADFIAALEEAARLFDHYYSENYRLWSEYQTLNGEVQRLALDEYVSAAGIDYLSYKPLLANTLYDPARLVAGKLGDIIKDGCRDRPGYVL